MVWLTWWVVGSASAGLFLIAAIWTVLSWFGFDFPDKDN